MKVLIIGCGYVGLPLGAELARQGHKVWGLRRSGAATPELAAAGVTPVQADVTVPDSLVRLPREFDWVVNTVAAGGGGAEEYRRVYLEGTRNLLAWLAPNPTVKYVYTSSTSVYGQNDGSVVDELSPAEPEAETSRTLVEAERLLLQAAREARFPAVVLRLAGIYGPGRGYWLRQFLAGAARIEGDGGRYLNMIHQADVVGAIVAALARGRAGEIYNVVDDEPVTQLSCLGWLAGALGRELPPAVPAQPEATRKRGVTSKRVSNRKLREQLGYRLVYPSFREGYSAELHALREVRRR